MLTGVGVAEVEQGLGPMQFGSGRKTPIRRELLLSRLANGATMEQAGTGLYSNEENAREAKRREQVNLLRELESHGLTLDYALSQLAEHTQADQTVFAQYDGQFTDRRDTPDWRARADALKTLLRLRGHLSNVDPSAGGNVNVAIVLGATEAPPWAPQPSEVQPGDVESGTRTAVVPSQPDIVPVQSQPIAASPVAAQIASPTLSRSQGTGSAPAATRMRTLAKIGPVGTPCKKKRKSGTVRIIAGTRP